MNEPALGDAPKKILFLTGTRADFGKLKPLITKVKQSTRFEYQIFATGMHMLARYGSTVNEIRKAGFDRLFSFINQDHAIGSQMDMVLANTVQGLSLYLREFPADLIVIHGDRVEALAGAIVGALNNVLVAHVEGGELSGTIDELIRHAVTKLSHLHFVSHDEAKRRLIQMGEAPESVYVIGSPDIDIMLSGELPALPEVLDKYSIAFADYGIAMYHPVTTEKEALPAHAEAFVEGLLGSSSNFVVIYPNNDAGSDVILQRVLELAHHPRFRLIPSMRFEYFLTLLKHARAIVGNSSAGICEAPVYGVPTVNVGTRQLNRFLYPSIVNVADDAGAIIQALANLPQAVPPSLHFGKGNSAALFVSHLATRELWSTPRQKLFRELSLRLSGRPSMVAPAPPLA
ncbi:MAG TPA: UDP-N-acetylglucosamine 2-epimerase [Polyangiaceae bacterium]|nr:UDP-N-acetylglucosamine 2-epimerase [Polyangiaceae bacterium]